MGSLALVVGIVDLSGSAVLQRECIEMLIAVSLAVGLYIFSGNSGILSFGHMSFMALGAYTTALLTIPGSLKHVFFQFPGPLVFLYSTEWSAVAGIVAGGAVAGVFALLTGVVLSRLSGIQAGIGTLAILIIVHAVILASTPVTMGAGTVVGVPVTASPENGLLLALFAIAVGFVYQRSRAGRRLKASREDEPAAAALGIAVTRERMVAFVISGIVTGIAGGYFAQYSAGFSPSDFFFSRTFLVVAMLVVGGMFSLSGAVVGAVLISVAAVILQQFQVGIAVGNLNIVAPTGTTDIVLGLVMLFTLISRPQGLLGYGELRWPSTPWHRSAGSANQDIREADAVVAAIHALAGDGQAPPDEPVKTGGTTT
jgi:branched-chain amino acid transport system permease protein